MPAMAAISKTKRTRASRRASRDECVNRSAGKVRSWTMRPQSGEVVVREFVMEILPFEFNGRCARVWCRIPLDCGN